MHPATLLSLAFLAVVPAALAAQQPYPECDDPVITADQQNINICNAAVDGSRLFHPVAGLLVSGGNPVIGSIRTLGGFPHFSLTLRVTASKVVTPDLTYDGSGGPNVDKDQEVTAPIPQLEAAIGVFPGFNGLFSVDVLGSAVLIPAEAVDNLSVDSDARKIGDIALGLGYGVRVGVFQGRAVIPSLVLSAMRRDIPRIGYGEVGGSQNYSFSVDLHATNLRAVAGYRLGMFDLGAGLGWDKYTGDAQISFEDQILAVQREVNVDMDQSRTLAFITAGLNVAVVKIGAEIGYQFGTDDDFRTTFEGNDPSDKRLFASGGVRFTF